jgi:ABC-type amino acid transport substrate-binding protein
MKNYILTFAISIFLLSCSKINGTDSSPGKFVVATSADNPPYEFINNGKIVGFDIDLAEEIAKELDQELVIKNLDFPGLLPALLSGNVDAVIAALTVTPDRLNNVDFSESYIGTEMAVLYKDGMVINSNEDLQKKTIGVQFGTTWEDYAKQLVEDTQGGRIKSLSNNLTLIQELNNSNVDIVIMEKQQVEKFTAKYSDLKSLAIPETRSDFAIAFSKDSELTEKVNRIIQKLKATGFLAQLQSKWLSD